MIQLKQALRRLARSPSFSVTTLLVLAIGIGATTAIFSVVNGVLLEPLPYPASERLVELRQRSPSTGDNWLPISPALYFTYREHNESLESVALWQRNDASVTSLAEPEEVNVLTATFEFLPTLGVVPALGRGFTAADDDVSSPRTVILTASYWQSRFGGGDEVLGTTLVIDGMAHEIVGVLPRDFRFGRDSFDLLLPMRPNPAIAFVGPLGENGLARLRPGVTIADANADLERLFPVMLETFPPVPGMDPAVSRNLRLRPNLVTLKDAVVGDLGGVLWILLGTIGLLLFLACANVANLLLVRTESRGQEFAVRAALGASGRHLVAGLLLESTMIALGAGVLGTALAAAALTPLTALAAAELPYVLRIALDPTVVVFALAVSLVSGLIVGALPALRYAMGRVAPLPTAGRAHTQGRERRNLQRALIVTQVALALTLLVASGLMIRSFVELRRIDPGFTRPDDVQVVTVGIPQATEREFSRVTRMFNDMQNRISNVAGVDGVGFISRLPLEQGPSSGFFLEDRPAPNGEAPPQSEFRYASPRVFETLGTPLVAGRTFEWQDEYGPGSVAIVSESFARREWGAPELALGKRLRMTPAQPWREIVGVVGDVRLEVLERPAPPAVYLTLEDPLAQYMSRRVSFVVRSDRAETTPFLEDLQRAIWSVDTSLPLASVRTLGEVYDESMARTSLTLMLLGITAAMALLLGLIGVYGAMSYMLAQRTREIGIRLALGAPSGAVRRLLLAHVAALVALGLALGLGGAAALARLMSSLLYGITAFDIPTYVVVSVLLVGTTLLAGYLPARRASRVDPMRALREE